MIIIYILTYGEIGVEKIKGITQDYSFGFLGSWSLKKANILIEYSLIFYRHAVKGLVIR